MRSFADTSFLCSLYRDDVFSEQADRWMRDGNSPFFVSTLVLFEFRQSIRLQTRLHASQPAIGLSADDAVRILRQQEQDLDRRVFEPLGVDWPSVHKRAESLSDKHTWTTGIRFADILHVATALEVRSEVFLTFDARQAVLARAEGLVVPFAT